MTAGLRLAFLVAIFSNALLLFLLQPMFGKMALPHLGGSAAVWTTCMLFFQTALLLGYLYAHGLASWLPPSRQVAVHLSLIAIASLVLPVSIPAGWSPADATNPAPSLLALLMISLGAPFTLIAAGSPLIQHWYSRSPASGGRDPYALYAASNLGSVAALVAYPAIVEPWLALRTQSLAWFAGYALLAVILLICGWSAHGDNRSASTEPAHTSTAEGVSWRSRVSWLALSAVPSSLLLGVTTHLTTDLAPVPLLWVVPLALYLLTFVIAFGEIRRFPTRTVLSLLPYPVLAVTVLLFLRAEVPGWGGYAIHLVAFFVCALACHVTLVRCRPAPYRLTEFYVWLSIGGALGAAFNVLLAPRIFTSVAEYPLALVAAVAFGPTNVAGRRSLDFVLPATLALCLVGALTVLANSTSPANDAALAVVAGVGAIAVFTFRDRPPRLALGVLALLGASLVLGDGTGDQRLAARSFYGVYRVVDDSAAGHRNLYSGTTIHGSERFADRGRVPLAYYHRQGPLGDIFAVHDRRAGSSRVAVVGLGAGAAAAYARDADSWSFYEIDPLVARIATDTTFFHFIAESRSIPHIVIGDARLSLARENGRPFDLIVIDAFSSDAIPAHLITREALRLYHARLTAEGIIAWHISNKYVDLRPVLEGLASEAGLVALLREDVNVSPSTERLPSVWVAMTATEQTARALRSYDGWVELRTSRGPIVWRDDFSNVLGVLR